MMDVTVETSTPCLFSNPSLSIYQMYVLEVDELASTVRTPHLPVVACSGNSN